jgi:hypothetical protein
MRVTQVGTRPAPASLREMLSRVIRGQSPQVVVQRREIPYWQQRGWTRETNVYTGNYQTPYGAFVGWIEQEHSGHISFYLYAPSQEIQRHSHWTCFQHRGNDWYLIHMAREPRDVSSGIITIEKLLTEAYQQ